ncbi:MAG: twin-arginine translocase TatA/TatE family subunit [Candidatus Latescibacteria bacterium]|nr:twin-arginine translocase TatA/TatE family subunit [Candidatus Latescibacterota bacterium]
MFGLGPMELVIIFLIILLVFGAKRIPEIAQGLGKGITEFKKAARDVTEEFDVSNTSTTHVKNELKGKSAQNSQNRTTATKETKEKKES